jgi:hypothetical protein
MKMQEGFKNNNNGQGQTKSDRANASHSKQLKEKGISNSGGQPSFTTSTKYTQHPPEKKKD